LQRGWPTVDKSFGHNRSLDDNKRLGLNSVAALPFASANFRRKTSHANHNNWHIAPFGNPLPQQAANPNPKALGSKVS
jgi:hypothetical protein